MAKKQQGGQATVDVAGLGEGCPTSRRGWLRSIASSARPDGRSRGMRLAPR